MTVIVDHTLQAKINKKPSRKIYKYNKADWAKIHQDLHDFQSEYLGHQPVRKISHNKLDYHQM